MSDFALDHVGIGVGDLDAAQAAFSKLGFTLTTRSQHKGRATGNHCIMLNEGYIELLGITDPGVTSSFYAMLERYEGVHIVAFGCSSSDRTYAALAARDAGVEPPQLLERDTQFGPDGSELRRAAFKNIALDGTRHPEARFLLIEHLTRDVLWQPHLLAHPNGAIGLAEVAICAADVAATAQRLSRLLGVTADCKSSDIATLDLPRGRVYVLSPAIVPKWAKGVAAPAVPSVVGLGVKVADLAATKRYLSDTGVAYNEHPYPAVWLEPRLAHGAVLSFIQA